MFKDVQNPILQLRVLLDFSVILIIVSEHTLNKPGENNNKIIIRKRSIEAEALWRIFITCSKKTLFILTTLIFKFL